MQSRAIVEGIQNSYRNLRVYLRKKYLPQKYVFHSKPHQDLLGYWGIKRQQYSANTQKQKFVNPFLCLGLFLLGFGVTDFVYSLRNNSKQSYRLYIMYPKVCKMIDDIFEDPKLQPWIHLSKNVFVTSLPEYNLFWSQVHQNIWGEKQKTKAQIQNKKIALLKQQLKQVDEKYPMPKVEQKQSVF